MVWFVAYISSLCADEITLFDLQIETGAGKTSNRQGMTTKLTNTVVANGSKPADNNTGNAGGIPMIEVKREEDAALLVETGDGDTPNGNDNNGVDLVPIMDNTEDHHETHF